MERRSWAEFDRAPADPEETKQLSERVSEMFNGLQPDQREVFREYLVRTAILREASPGASEGTLRDIAAERRVAQKLLRLVRGPEHDDRGG